MMERYISRAQALRVPAYDPGGGLDVRRSH
jgi:hypothetical protein